MVVPTNPPDITYQPWCPVTLVLKHGGNELKATIISLTKALVTQLDPLTHGFRAQNDNSVNKNGGPLFQIRLRSVRAWNLTGHMIALSVNDLTSDNKSNTDTLCGIVDTGSSTHTPAVGYDYPQSHKDIVFHNDGADMDDPVFHVITPNGDTSIVYVSLLWRFDGPSKLSSFAQSMHAIVAEMNKNVSAGVKRLNTTSTAIKNSISAIQISTDKIEKHTDSGGIGNAIVKGVEIAAPYVIPAIAAEDAQRIDRLVTALERQSISASTSFAELSDVQDS